MIILGIDSSTKTASVGICDGEKVLSSFTLNHKRTHSEKLLEMIDMSLKIAQLDIKDVDVFAVTKGPGSFTGLRIGLATVKGLCHALNKPCYTVSTLDALYENVYDGSEGILYAPLMDARRGEVYCSAYFNGKKVIEDSAMPLNEFLEKIKEIQFDKVMFTGDGVYPNLDLIKDFEKKYLIAPEHILFGSGPSVIKAALKYGKPLGYEEVSPEYLRLSQAERVKGEN